MQPGREWEVLVAQLEQLFAGSGFRVQSPENIRSAQTGNIVKVDVTVRGRVGSQDVLIAFECRDRNGAQGVEWIQQLPARKADIGASELIAVSRDGFTADAEREAAAHGIPLRTLERLSREDMAAFLLDLELELWRPRYQARLVDFSRLTARPFGVDIHFSEWPKFTAEHLQALLDQRDTPQVVDCLEGGLVSVVDLIHRANWAPPFADGVFEGRRAYTAELAPGRVDEFGHQGPRLRYWLDAGHGVDLEGLSFSGEVWWDREPVELSQALRYAAGDGTLATVAEFDLTPHGIPHTLTVIAGPQ